MFELSSTQQRRFDGICRTTIVLTYTLGMNKACLLLDPLLLSYSSVRGVSRSKKQCCILIRYMSKSQLKLMHSNNVRNKKKPSKMSNSFHLKNTTHVYTIFLLQLAEYYHSPWFFPSKLGFLLGN